MYTSSIPFRRNRNSKPIPPGPSPEHWQIASPQEDSSVNICKFTCPYENCGFTLTDVYIKTVRNHIDRMHTDVTSDVITRDVITRDVITRDVITRDVITSDVITRDVITRD